MIWLLALAWSFECAVAVNSYDCPTPSAPACFTWANPSVLWRGNASDFSAVELDTIEDAAEAWNAGPGEVNRGADFTFVRGSDGTTDGILGDYVNEVRRVNDAWFAARGFPGDTFAAVELWVIPSSCGGIVEFDMSIRENSVDKATNDSLLESDALPPDVYSLGQLALHEFGHALGLGEETQAFQATMDPAWPHGGDQGELGYRIQEHDFVGLRTLYPGTSGGGNLALSRFQYVGGGAPTAKVGWTTHNRLSPSGPLPDDGRTWAAFPGALIPVNSGPTPVFASITGGVGGTANPKVEWELTANTCFDGSGYAIATRTPGLVINKPAKVKPSVGYQLPANIPPGFYNLCAKIDADDQISESSELDNIVRSDRLFEVL